MLFLAFIGLVLLSVPLLGGKLGRLADVEIRVPWLLVAAIGIQILVISVVPRGSPLAHRALHVGSYGLVGVFLWVNRRLPGLMLIAFGGAMNFVAIAANGGVMPESASAFSASGLADVTGTFSNSAPMGAPKLHFLGDIFAIPRSWPLHNVFSLGDVCIAIGVVVALHRICGSRLFRTRTGQFAQLRAYPTFMRLWGAQAVSNVGDWIYTLAVATALDRAHGGAGAFALLFVCQLAPSAAIGALGGGFVDRLPRKKLMIASDVLRGLAVLSLLAGGTPSRMHVYVVAFLLGAFGALFLPSLQASLPNVVPPDDLVAANALVSSTFHAAVMVGPVIGGLLVGTLGVMPAFAVNAATFGVSALLLAGAALPQRIDDDDEDEPSPGPITALREGVRYMAGTPLVRNVLLVLGVLMIAAALKSPLEPLFILRTLGRRPDALGVVGGAWGTGMVIGSLCTPNAARRWPRERLFAVALALVGACVLLASRQHTLSPVLLLWVAAGFGNGMGTVSYETLLQERVPDSMRGRVMAASEAILDGAFLVGALIAGALGNALGIPAAFAASGGLFLVASAMTLFLLARRTPAPAPAETTPTDEELERLVTEAAESTTTEPALVGAIPALAAPAVSAPLPAPAPTPREMPHSVPAPRPVRTIASNGHAPSKDRIASNGHAPSKDRVASNGHPPSNGAVPRAVPVMARPARGAPDPPPAPTVAARIDSMLGDLMPAPARREPAARRRPASATPPDRASR